MRWLHAEQARPAAAAVVVVRKCRADASPTSAGPHFADQNGVELQRRYSGTAGRAAATLLRVSLQPDLHGSRRAVSPGIVRNGTHLHLMPDWRFLMSGCPAV